MGKITYYLAISLDGYLARQDGSVDWLDAFREPLGTPYDYSAFYETTEALILGRKTFEMVQSFGDYPYTGKQAYVFTRNLRFEADVPEVHVVREELPFAIRQIRSAHEGRVWLVGGGELAGEIAQTGLLDEIVLTIVPVTLGWGLPWLSGHLLQTDWALAESHACANSVVQLIYRRKYPVVGSGRSALPPSEAAKA